MRNSRQAGPTFRDLFAFARPSSPPLAVLSLRGRLESIIHSDALQCGVLLYSSMLASLRTIVGGQSGNVETPARLPGPLLTKAGAGFHLSLPYVRSTSKILS